MARTNPGSINLPLVDAHRIQGIPVGESSPADGQALVFDAGAGMYVPSTVSGSGGEGSGAPADVQYLTLATNGTLSAERVLTPGAGLRGTDGGAGGAYTLAIDDGVVATVSGATFTGPLTAPGGISGSLTRLADGRSFIVGAGSVTVTSSSSGQVVVSGSGGGVVDLSGYAQLAGATFTGLVIAANGASASYFAGPGSPASAGDVRLRAGGTIQSRNAADDDDVPLLSLDGGNEVLLGTNAAYNRQANLVRVYGAGGVYLGKGSTSTLFVSDTGVESFRPVVAAQLTSSTGMHLSDGALSLSGSNSTDGLIRLPWRPETYTVMSAKTEGSAMSYPVIQQSGNAFFFGNLGALITYYYGYQNVLQSTAHTWIYSYGAPRATFDHVGLGLAADNRLRVGGLAADTRQTRPPSSRAPSASPRERTAGSPSSAATPSTAGQRPASARTRPCRRSPGRGP